MSHPAGLGAPHRHLSPLRPTATQLVFAGSWAAILAFCALTWALAFALAL